MCVCVGWGACGAWEQQWAGTAGREERFPTCTNDEQLWHIDMHSYQLTASATLSFHTLGAGWTAP